MIRSGLITCFSPWPVQPQLGERQRLRGLQLNGAEPPAAPGLPHQEGGGGGVVVARQRWRLVAAAAAGDRRDHGVGGRRVRGGGSARQGAGAGRENLTFNSRGVILSMVLSDTRS